VIHLLRSGVSRPASSSDDERIAANIYHLHPLVAGALAGWSATFARIAAMGFSHVCLAPPFEPGASGDIFIHATFDRLHPALGFNGPAEQGIALAAELASRAGLRLMLDIAPGQVAIGSPLWRCRPDWFSPAAGDRIADPRRPPHRTDVATPRFDQTAVADAVSDWWIALLTRLTGTGVAGFRCLTLDLVPPSFWRRLTAAFPEALFLAWTAGVTGLADFAGAGFGLTCSPGDWWDGRASWFLEEQAASRAVAPALVSPEPSFLDRLAQRLPSETDVPAAYRLALRIAASIGAGLFLPMGFEYVTRRCFDAARASPADLAAAEREMPADLSEYVASAIRLNRELPPVAGLRPITSPAARVTAFLRSGVLVAINPDLVRPAPLGFPLVPLPSAAGAAIWAEDAGDALLRPGEVRILPCHRMPAIPGGGQDLVRPWAEATRIAVEAVRPGGDFTAKAVVGRDFTVSADVFGDGHDVLAADLLWRPADEADWRRIPMRGPDNDRWEASVRPDRIGLYRFAVEGWWDQWGTFTHDLHAKVEAGQDVALEIQEGRQLLGFVMAGEGGDLCSVSWPGLARP
jgi:starch synthase (maltosyl-transferring)